MTAIMATRAASIGSDRRGSVAVEFAIVAPVVILIFVAVFELGFMELSRSVLEAAARDASRFGILGVAEPGRGRDQIITDIIHDATAGFFEPSKVLVSYQVYRSFDENGQPLAAAGTPEPFEDTNRNGSRDSGETYTDVNLNGRWDPDMSVAAGGGPGDIVVYTATASRPFLTPFWAAFIGETEARFRVIVAVRNELFPTEAGS